MSIYYILVNKNKKEWIDSGDIGLGLKIHVYETSITPLLGFLMLQEWYDITNKEQYDPQKHILELSEDQMGDNNFTFQGHWCGDTDVALYSEHTQEYDICHAMEDQYKYNGYMGNQEEWNNELKGWMNISVPLAKEYNYRINYWYKDNPDMADWLKHHSFKI